MPDTKRDKLWVPEERHPEYPMAADAVISIGDLVVINTATVATGVAERASVATTLTGVGFAVEARDNTGGAAGDLTIMVSTAPHAVALQAGTMSFADLGATVYAVDEDIVDGDSDSDARSAFGTLRFVDEDGTLFIEPTIK